jgi:hypothetical protein
MILILDELKASPLMATFPARKNHDVKKICKNSKREIKLNLFDMMTQVSFGGDLSIPLLSS